MDAAHPEDIDLFAAALGHGRPEPIDAHLRECDDCRGKMRDLGELGARLSLAPEPASPPPRLASNLRAYLRGDSFDGFARRAAGLFDLQLDAARELLQRVRRGDEFEPMVPGMDALVFEGGPATAGAACFAARFTAGSRHPRHRHPGEEHVLVLTGAYRDDATNRVVGVGDIGHSNGGSEHGLYILPKSDCVALLLAEGGLPEYLGVG